MIKLGKASIDETPLTISKDIHVTVDGVEVTGRCREASALNGTALCYKLNDEGKMFVDISSDEVAVETLKGEVAIWFDGDEEAWFSLIQVERDRDNVLEEAA